MELVDYSNINLLNQQHPGEATATDGLHINFVVKTDYHSLPDISEHLYVAFAYYEKTFNSTKH